MLWFWLYFAIIALGISMPNSEFLTYIKVGSIFLCLVYVCLFYPNDRLLQLAMFTTSIADIILAVNNTAIPGILTFLVTQLIHCYRLLGPKVKIPLAIFVTLAASVTIAVYIWQFYPPIYIVCIFYAIAIITNVFASYHWFKHDFSNLHARFAFLGFALFLCCDACTVLSYLSLNLALPVTFYAPANFLVWLFYYPSQVFISNSSKYAIIKTKGR